MSPSAKFAAIHAPLSMRSIDAAGAVLGFAFLGIAAYSIATGAPISAAVAFIGGAYLIYDARRNRREVHAAVWEMAAEGDDPIAVLALCEHFYRLPIGDLVVICEWRPGDEVPPQMVEAYRVQRPG